mmetsp:Transcript_26343/g.4576  ORF Transcript_26343/g.4576 Transcript_26343/m.4576 type:complete len:164 (-) Transcript_26343:89-580(-)|eukprot:CAMPEP_0168316394 /NCGR_PEP_ID=MMETSP0210-20121227/15335_1 /TAXON_ID=40633 /ORGANISM="Condylostoma magnum, Strain COL2" /LENGTH=163 /DNA_ID=CAMNT_0008296783 /DNA_START=620 /DNA_END=1111 /DNA_ORIENTATION=-
MQADFNSYTTAETALNVDMTDTSGNVAIGEEEDELTFTLDLSTKRTALVDIYNTNGSNDTPSAMSLPRVASNKYTRYEAYIELTENNVKYADFIQFSITAPPLDTANVIPLCLNVKAIELEPAFNASTDSKNKYYVDILFNSAYPVDLGSGLTGTHPYSYPVA